MRPVHGQPTNHNDPLPENGWDHFHRRGVHQPHLPDPYRDGQSPHRVENPAERVRGT